MVPKHRRQGIQERLPVRQTSPGRRLRGPQQQRPREAAARCRAFVQGRQTRQRSASIGVSPAPQPSQLAASGVVGRSIMVRLLLGRSGRSAERSPDGGRALTRNVLMPRQLSTTSARGKVDPSGLVPELNRTQLA